MAAALRELGFDVIDKIDVTQKEMNRAIALFGEKLNANTIALFYYAGHGMQVRGKNYLIPVDAEIAAEASVRAETVDVDTVLDQLNRSPLSIVILDACRNNPFERRFRSTGGGLAAMDAPKGTLIAYATSPGSVASDGTGRNGLYTQELLKAMRTPGLPVERMFKEVRRNVTRASDDAQTPWEMSSLTGEFYFKPGTGTQVASLESVPAPTQPATRVKSKEEIEDDTWRAAEDANILDSYETYLSAYSNGRYAAQAKIKLATLKKPTANLPQAVPQVNTMTTTVAPKGYVAQGGLTWMPVTFQKNWEDANSYCANTTIIGQTDWRLPTKDELSVLYASKAMKDQGWAFGATWSSTPTVFGTHYFFFLDRGRIDMSFNTSSRYVTCVR